MQSILFKNWTTDLFIGKWDGVEYAFTPGQSMYVEDWKALHFAKHLADKAMQADGLNFDHFSRQKYLDKCFVEAVDVNEKTAEVEIVNKNIEEGNIEPKRKGGKSKKVSEESDFEGLKE
jgi:hypothetical protein